MGLVFDNIGCEHCRTLTDFFAMTESDTQLADAGKMPAKVGEVFAEKMQRATETFNEPFGRRKTNI